MKKSTYDYIFSLGQACFTATMLRKLSLRTMSSPFDWMYGASLEERFEILLSGFENYFNKEDLVYVGLDSPKKDCYKNTRTGIHYNHDFPKGVNFDIFYPKIAEQYKRRTEKCLKTIEKSKRVLIIYINVPETNLGEISQEKLLSLIEKINKKYPKTQIDFLHIKNNDNLKENEVIYKEISENLLIAECYQRSYNSDEPACACNFNNTKQVLSYLRIKNQWLNNIRRRIMRLYSSAKNHCLTSYYKKRGV